MSFLLQCAYHEARLPPRGPAFVSVPMGDGQAGARVRAQQEVFGGAAPKPRALKTAAGILPESRRPAVVAVSVVDRAGAFYDAAAPAEKLGRPYRQHCRGPPPEGQDTIFRGH